MLAIKSSLNGLRSTGACRYCSAGHTGQPVCLWIARLPCCLSCNVEAAVQFELQLYYALQWPTQRPTELVWPYSQEVAVADEQLYYKDIAIIIIITTNSIISRQCCLTGSTDVIIILICDVASWMSVSLVVHDHHNNHHLKTEMTLVDAFYRFLLSFLLLFDRSLAWCWIFSVQIFFYYEIWEAS